MSVANRQRVGEVRPSQVIHTFGVGSVIDLPNFSAIVMGTNEWDPPLPQDVVVEDRLLSLVRNHLGPQVERLVAPPTRSDEGGRLNPLDSEANKGLPVSPFPRWVRCPMCNLIAPLNFGVFSLKTDPWHPDRIRYVHDNCQKVKGNPPAVIPVRFVRACDRGHMDDFPWVEFVHGGKSSCAALLRLYEFGVSAEAADIVVKCESCNVSRPMALAFSEEGKKLIGVCSGRHPHLRSVVAGCEGSSKAMLAGASNLWFSVTVSALSIPPDQGRLGQVVREQWPILEHVKSTDILAAFRNAGQLQAFAEWSNAQVWQAIEAKRNEKEVEGPRRASEIKTAEWEVFARPDARRNDSDFRLVVDAPPRGYEALIDKVVRVERLRVVKAQIGFTRILSPGDLADVSEIPEIRRAPLSRARPTWVPASEVRGEGIFIQFSEAAIGTWLEDRRTRTRELAFSKAHRDFRRVRDIESPEANFPGIRFVLLHSLSHALIRQLAIECGYGAASVQERIYAADASGAGAPMAGILLYTAAADSEGTLGGLVSLGRPHELGRHLDHALEDLRLCASDPLCSEHIPGDSDAALHGASCHACLFAAETSCERGNKYLDRTLLVQTMGGVPLPFFETMLEQREHGD